MLSTLILLLPGCDRDGGAFIPVPNPDYPFIQELGEFRVIPVDEQEANVVDRKSFISWGEDLRAEDDAGRKGIHYGGIGAPEDPSYFGGATFTFLGTGGDVCLVMDPETVFWNQALAGDVTTSQYLYVDAVTDDADLDLDAGLSAYYNGSPGLEMGEFEIIYTDAGGADHGLPASECIQLGSQKTPAHAGRSTVEYCTIDTSGRVGVEFTAVLDTFLLPLDDGVINYAVAAFEGSCGELTAAPRGIDECVLSREGGGALDTPEDRTTTEYCENPDNPWNDVCLEAAFCSKVKDLNQYCVDHFTDDDAPCSDNGVHPPADDETVAPGTGL
ncbi:MAG: hypothetical protein EXR71_02995 [Myxococcales bacterium]|nr:hypothetical protein [Myxococcales bacterium]